MEQIKKTIALIRRAVRRVVTHRAFAAVVMSALTLVLSVHISTNTKAITVDDGNESLVVVTMNDDAEEVLETTEVEVSERETVTVETPDTVEEKQTMTVEVKADGISTLMNMTEGTVQDALDKAGVTLSKTDDVNRKLSSSVKHGMLIKVDRVTYKEYKITKAIDYEVIYKYTGALRPGKSAVQTYGKEGQRTITYRKTIVNGKVTETKQVNNVVTKQPVNKVVLKGTKVGTPISKAPYTVKLDDGGQPLKYKKVLTGQCTAYTNDSGDSGSWTATGKHVAVGLVAVDPRVIPYGTKMWITSADGSVVYGYAIAADTGGALRSGKVLVDLFMNTLTECNSFGRRNMKVYILE